ncbi:MAG: hypothetical protein IPP43_14480 [Chitinophagaceae bacterium]|nr:hypothetical protein [Chitinophagaceae bacterium]
MKIKILIVLMLSGMIVQGQNTNLAVIANPGGAPAGLKQAELNSIFMGETPKWSNGSKIVLALMKTNTTAGKLTCDKVYHMSGDELTKFWLSQMIDGKVAAPTFFNTVADLQTFVSEKPGAIGIIDLTAPIAGVRVITVEGKKSF